MYEKVFTAKTNNSIVQLFRYGVSGGTAFLVNIFLLWFLTEQAGLNYIFSNAIGFSAGLIITYLFSIWWIFSVRRLNNVKVEFSIFAIIGGVGLALDSLLIWVFTDLYGLFYLHSKIFTTILVTFWNFFARKYILFTKK